MRPYDNGIFFTRNHLKVIFAAYLNMVKKRMRPSRRRTAETLR